MGVLNDQTEIGADSRPGESGIIAGEHVQRLVLLEAAKNRILLGYLVVDPLQEAVHCIQIRRPGKQETVVVCQRAGGTEVRRGQVLLHQRRGRRVEPVAWNDVAWKGAARGRIIYRGR